MSCFMFRISVWKLLYELISSTEKRSSEEAEKEAPAAKKAKVQENESTEAVEETAA